MIKLIVDSTCDLSEEDLERYDILTVPMMLSIGDTEYRDKINIQPSEVYSSMRNGITPKTAQVDSDWLGSVYERYCREGHDFIYIAFSSAMSCTCHTARVLLEEYNERYPERNMAVIDSRGGSMATGLIAIQAARLIEHNHSFTDVCDCIREMTEYTEHIFTIMDLKWLIKGGRIDPITGTIGSILGVKPVISVKNGGMCIVKKARGKDNAIASIVEMITERIKDFPEQLIGIAHSDSLPAAKSLQKTLESKLESASFMIGEIGSVLASHIGVGALGVFFFSKKFAFYIA